MRRVVLGGSLLALLVGACSSTGGRSVLPTPTPTPTVRPTSPRPAPRPSPTRKPSPSPSPVSGDPIGPEGSRLELVTNSSVIPIGPRSDCRTFYPELSNVSCDEVPMDGGSLVWVQGSDNGAWSLRLLTLDQAAGGYRLRYRSTDFSGRVTGHRLAAAPLAGHGTDGLVVQTLVHGAPPGRSYDVLTWRAGGPLVLRAHRPVLAHGRVVAREMRVDEYEGAPRVGESPCCPSRMHYRVLRWDGRLFRLQRVGFVRPADAPRPD